MVIRMHRRVFRSCTAGTILACGLLTMAIATFQSASFDNTATIRAAELVLAGSFPPPGNAIAV